jgi:hypothetical protein
VREEAFNTIFYVVVQLPEFIVNHLENNVGILPALTRAHLETNQTVTSNATSIQSSEDQCEQHLTDCLPAVVLF